MNETTKKEKLRNLFANVGEAERNFACDAIDEYLFFESKLKELQTMQLIQIGKRDPAQQRVTPAGKLIKDYSQVVDAKRSTLLRILYRTESSAADEFMARLSEFE